MNILRSGAEWLSQYKSDKLTESIDLILASGTVLSDIQAVVVSSDSEDHANNVHITGTYFKYIIPMSVLTAAGIDPDTGGLVRGTQVRHNSITRDLVFDRAPGYYYNDPYRIDVVLITR